MGTEAKSSIAVIIPNFNHSRLIRRNLQRLADQTQAPDEIIVVDDASTDDSLAAIESFGDKFPQMKIVRNSRNLGVNETLNVGLSVARSAFVVSSAADDYLQIEFVEKMRGALEMFPDARLCTSQYVEHIEASDELRFYSCADDSGCWFADCTAYFSPTEFHALLDRKYVWLPINAAVVHADTFRRLGGYDPALKWHADWFAAYTIAFRHGFAVVPEPLSVFRIAEGTYSAGARRRATEREVGWAIYQKLQEPAFSDIRAALARHPAAFSPFFHDLVTSLAMHCQAWPFLASIMPWWLREFSHGRRPAVVRDLIGALRWADR